MCYCLRVFSQLIIIEVMSHGAIMITMEKSILLVALVYFTIQVLDLNNLLIQYL